MANELKVAISTQIADTKEQFQAKLDAAAKGCVIKVQIDKSYLKSQIEEIYKTINDETKSGSSGSKNKGSGGIINAGSIKTLQMYKNEVAKLAADSKNVRYQGIDLSNANTKLTALGKLKEGTEEYAKAAQKLNIALREARSQESVLSAQYSANMANVKTKSEYGDIIDKFKTVKSQDDFEGLKLTGVNSSSC